MRGATRVERDVSSSEPLVLRRPDTLSLTPGKSLAVLADDHNLRCGRSPLVRLRVTASSGDEEVQHMLPWGDSKTELRANISTALGPSVTGDYILQVREGDTVCVTFDDRTMEAWRLDVQPVITYRVTTKQHATQPPPGN